jgi:hypothetical protein
MRHTSLLGQPNPVPLLPSSMVSPATLGPLVPAAGLPHRLPTSLTTAGIRAVPLPAIALRAHHHLASASVAAQQSSVVRGPAASPTDRRAWCRSSSKALYSSPAGLVPRGGSGLGCYTVLGPLPVFSQQRIIAQPALYLACCGAQRPTSTTQRQLLVCITKRPPPSATSPIHSILDLD